jgi:glycosyltransferase involved in cell wall biosynthesis
MDNTENIEDRAMPLLSVTVLNYNYARYLPQCLDSILAQTVTDFELILINDCSTDNSLEVIEQYLADPRIRLVNHVTNRGFVPSLVEGAQLSRGKYITVISADDYCVSDRAFEALLQPLESDESVVFAYSSYGLYADDGVRQHVFRAKEQSYVRSGIEEFRELAIECNVMHSGTIVRTSTYNAVGGYNSSVRFEPGAQLWYILCSQGRVAYCADELYAYRVHPTSMCRSRPALQASIQEVIDGIDAAFAAMRDSLDGAELLYRRAIQNNLVAYATNYIFGGHLRAGWYSYWCGFRIHPLLTVCQRRTLMLLLRTLLGPRYIQILRAKLGRRQPAALSLNRGDTGRSALS